MSYTVDDAQLASLSWVMLKNEGYFYSDERLMYIDEGYSDEEWM